MGGESTIRSKRPEYPTASQGPVAKKFHPIYKDRLSNFSGNNQYKGDNLRSKLHEATISGDPHIKLSVYSPPNLSRPTFKEATNHEFRPTKIGKSFGPSWSTHWFKVQLKVPSELRHKERVEFHWNANNEGLIWSEHGEPLQGLTGGGEREEWILPDSFLDGKEHMFYIEMACNGMFGNAPGGDIIQPPAPTKSFELEKADIVAVNLEARALFFDFWIIKDAAREFSDETWQQHTALQVCNRIMDCFEVGQGSKESISECRKIAKQYLGNRVDSHKVYDESGGNLVCGIGNCHIDTCWLWPWAETKRKIARSWSNQCDLLDRYPEHRFACSQAQQFKWLEEYYPSLWDRVKKKVKEGSFQPIGGSWVEHDTNMPSGESLVRQFLYGQRFFQSRFGERSKTFWLPDTFGYSPQLPQICRQAGMSRFFTQKLSWNNINSFPHTTFNWVALDGTQVLCHMAPSETYTAEAHFGDVKRSMSQHKSMDQDSTSILAFGKGDGGGGPTFEHLEKLRRCRGLSDKVGLLPKVHLGDSVDDFFERLERRVEEGLKLVTWYGELYLELHRGTYTTQANMKRNNRYAERIFHDLEWLTSMASLKALVKSTKSSYKYPKKELDDMWEQVLLCQFHDCLPGSCIGMCYDDADKLYSEVFRTAGRLVGDAMRELGFGAANNSHDQRLAIHAAPWAPYKSSRSRENPNSFRVASDCRPLEMLPLNSFSKTSIEQIGKNEYRLSNERLSVIVNGGVITSVYDKHAEREVISPGSKANQYVIYDDKPLYWQAWDVEVYHASSRKELTPNNISISHADPDQDYLVIETQISEKSSIETYITLSRIVNPTDPAFIDVECSVKWHENKKFLKVEFPVDILNNEASYETQYGIMRRATHYNTSWDMAKFEVTCHKWADLSEATYGVSILNDSKYGFATEGKTMRLSLLRSPKAPDEVADMGNHKFRYAILPHAGPLGAETVWTAYTFNQRHYPWPTNATGENEEPLSPESCCSPWIATHPRPDSVADLLASIQMSADSSPAIILDCIKRGEDDEDVSRGELPKRKGQSIIIRLYDSLGGLCRGNVQFGILPVRAVRRCNILEDDEADVELDSKSNSFKIEVRPFQVQTYRLVL